MMRKTLTLLLAVTTSISALKAQRYRTGLSLEEVMPDNVEIYDPEEFGFSGKLPESFSLKEYAPYPKNQGEFGTCVGWAFGYTGMSVLYAQKFNIKNRNYITATAMCPFTIYNDVKTASDASCTNGTYLHLAADLLKRKGTKRYYLDENTCGKTSKKDNVYRVFKVQTYAALWDMRLAKDATAKTKTEKTKTALANGQPVIIAFKTTYSFCSTGVDSSGLWDKTKGWLYPTGGHAMAVIGYDDKKFGGAFEIQNSWGQDWGKGGYCWVKYADFAEFVYGAYVMTLSDQAKAGATKCQLGNCENGYCRYLFESGDAYEGEIKGKKFEGSGIYQWANGDVYVGDFKEGIKHGKGTYYFADGTIKKGYWAGDTLNERMDYLEYTYGTVKLAENEFTGYQKGDAWLFGNLEVKRTYSRETYSGKFMNNKKNDFGLTRKSYGTIFVGEIENESYTNYFSMINPGDEFVRIFEAKPGTPWKKLDNDPKLAAAIDIPKENVADTVASNDPKKCTYGDCMNGYGTYNYDSGNLYSGYFVNGYRQGYGLYMFMEGKVAMSYEGRYDNNKKTGVGKIKFNNTDHLIGEFDVGILNGYGIYVSNGKSVSGAWENGKYKEWSSEFGFGEAVTDKDKEGATSVSGRSNKYRPLKQNHTQIE